MPDIARARNFLANTALESNPSHVMWIDGDIVMADQSVIRLISHNLPVVGGVYFYKVEPHLPVVFDIPDDRSTIIYKDNLDPEEEVQQVGVMGMGCCLVESDVYRQWQKHFGNDEYYVNDGIGSGEDVYFFMGLHEMGVPVYIDPIIRCGHIREQMITSDEWDRTIPVGDIPISGTRKLLKVEDLPQGRAKKTTKEGRTTYPTRRGTSR